jgi:hypothetical protein
MENLFGNIQEKRGALNKAWNSIKKQPVQWATIPLCIFAIFVLSLFLGTITCLIKPGRTYERFDVKIPDQQISLTKEARKWTAILQKDEALLDRASDVTCTVFRQISQSQIQSDSAPTLDTPRPIDNAALQRRAVQKFKDAQMVYLATHNNQPLLECFGGEDDGAAASGLLAAYTALNAQLNDTQMKLKARKVNATLGFTRPYVMNALNSFSTTTEAFATNPTGMELVMKTYQLIEEASRTHTLIQALPEVAKHQKQVLELIDQQKASVSKSDGAEAKKDEYAEKGKDAKYSE